MPPPERNPLLHDEKTDPPLARRILVPIVFVIALYYLMILFQQGAKYLLARAFGAAFITLHMGLGTLKHREEHGDLVVKYGADWWWGPQVAARGKLTPTAVTLVNWGPLAVNLLIIILVLIDMRRSRNTLHYVILIANVLALLTAVLLPELYPQAYG